MPRPDNRPDNIQEYVVEAEQALLLQYISTAILRDHTPTKLKSMLRHRQFAVNSVPTTRYDAPLRRGDRVGINFDRSFAEFRHPRIELVYEDEHLLIINKGYGILSMGTDRVKEGTAYSIMREYVKANDPRAKVFIVHRLDRDTSGLMLLAKTEQAKETLQHNWNNMVTERRYVAVVEGEIEPPAGVVQSYLAENSQYEVYSTPDKNAGQLAITRYRTLRTSGKASLVELQLDTRRKNQIRVHMKDLGHPIIGDRKYGGIISPIKRLALHAQTLCFRHPVTDEAMSFEAPIPSSFFALLGRPNRR